MITKTALLDWLSSIPDDSHVAIDDGGLTLIAWTDDVINSYEIGGIPESEELKLDDDD